MKRMRAPHLLLALAGLLLLFAACGGQSEDPEGTLVYFVSTDKKGPALVGEPFQGEQVTPDALIAALLAGPQSEDLRSPFPTGLSLRGWTLEETCLHLDFSQQYGDLAGVSLTLADYCVVLTLCQAEGVESVEITAAGQTIPYRSHPVLAPGEVLLDSL